MNKQEYLLNQLSQECIEVAKEISKALEFGLDDFDPNESVTRTNQWKIERELCDVLATLKMVIKNEILDYTPIYDEARQGRKIDKIIKYMEYLRKVGALK